MTSSNEEKFIKNFLYVLVIGIIVGIGLGVLFVSSNYKEYLSDGTLVTTKISDLEYIVKILKITFISSFTFAISYSFYKFYQKIQNSPKR
ncbi:hypothetical protein [Lysinibacillus sp. 38-6]|uniref:hypothetical protein n=1 Tax=Lysinibacillus sp. 38-6 TaxID=3385991 RepID=UPI003908A443